MNLDGARNAKAEIFQSAFGFDELPTAQLADEQPVFAATPGTEAYDAILKARRARKRDPRDLIALGVLDASGHNRNPDELNVAIFIQQKRLGDHPIVQRAQRFAKGEATVIFTGPVRTHAAENSGRCRPLRVGASIGHERVSAGSLGCFAKKLSGGGIGLLSNNHVLANSNRCRFGDKIIQPGRADGGDRKSVADHVAMLDKFIPISFEPGSVNKVDCAFAYVVDGVRYIADVVGDEAIAWSIGKTDPFVYPSLRAKKLGRTTHMTTGVVEAINIDNLHVGFAFGGNPLIARFDGQIAITKPDAPFSKPGDSGSVLFNEHNAAFGLVFAGSERGVANGPGITFANPIGTVLDALEIEIYTGS